MCSQCPGPNGLRPRPELATLQGIGYRMELFEETLLSVARRLTRLEHDRLDNFDSRLSLLDAAHSEATKCAELTEDVSDVKASEVPVVPDPRPDVPCEDCGRPDSEWADWVLLPHEVFNSICPQGDGYLCLPCFCNRVLENEGRKLSPSPIQDVVQEDVWEGECQYGQVVFDEMPSFEELKHGTKVLIIKADSELAKKVMG